MAGYAPLFENQSAVLMSESQGAGASEDPLATTPVQRALRSTTFPFLDQSPALSSPGMRSDNEQMSTSQAASQAREERQLMRELKKLQQRADALATDIKASEEMYERRLKPMRNELDQVRAGIARHTVELDRLSRGEEVPPGPRELRWVEGDLFTLICMIVIMLNFLIMAFELFGTLDWEARRSCFVLDQVFLVWYIIELVLRAVLHQRAFLWGPMTSDRISRWIDLCIVISGVIDQWLVPLVVEEASDHHLPFKMSSLRVLRVLRVTRMFRLFKAIYLLFMIDLSWTDSARFEMFTTAIIIVNAVTMGLELDIHWSGWHVLNGLFLVIYTFEAMVKLQRHGKEYFTRFPSAYWNILDFVIVTGGLIESLALPAWHLAVLSISGAQPTHTVPSGILSLLRIFRLFRVLRLYRVMTTVKALRKLVVGIGNAMQGTMWVIILTFLILYIFAIVFTTLVGRGIVVSPDDHAEAVAAFGSVEMSVYMLFKLMNDDQSVVMFTDSVWVKLLFMLSMVALNWVMLATLTSVVTDHMNSATQAAEKAEEAKGMEERIKHSERRLISLFREIDIDSSGFIDDQEFAKMLQDDTLRRELSDASGLNSRDLIELFNYLSDNCEITRENKKKEGERVILYEDFVSKIKREKMPASERTVFRVEEELRSLERRMEQRFQNVLRVIISPNEAQKSRASEFQVDVPPPAHPWWEQKAQELNINQDRDNVSNQDTMSFAGLDDAGDHTPLDVPSPSLQQAAAQAKNSSKT